MVDIRNSMLEDLQRLAGCHASAFPKALSTRLGERATQKMLEWYIVSNRGVLFHLEQDGRLLAYCGGIKVHQPGRHGAFTSISQYAFWDFARAYLRRPWLLVDRENRAKYSGILRNIIIRLRLRSPNIDVTSAMRQEFRPSWGLVVIGVHADHRNKGYGSRLIGHFETLAREDRVDLVQLSVKAGNIAAVRAYEKNGWSVMRRAADSLQMGKIL
jgi:ribosomal protein S18 acetylase RimI-like enzyme